MTATEIVRLIAVMVLWATCFPLITIGLDLAPHLAFASMRAALAGACLLAFGVVNRRPIPMTGRSWVLVVVVAIGATSLGFFGMFHAAEFISPGLATVIANVQPLLAATMAYAFLGERLSLIGRFGLLMGFAGIVVIAWPGLFSEGVSGYAIGIAYVALAAIGVAVGNLAIARLAGQADAIMAMAFQLLVGAVPLAAVSILTEDVSTVTWSAEFILVLLSLSLLGTSLPFLLWFKALEVTELSRANAFTFLVPIFGLVIGATVFEERLEWTHAAGVALVLAGLLLVQRRSEAMNAHLRESTGG